MAKTKQVATTPEFKKTSVAQAIESNVINDGIEYNTTGDDMLVQENNEAWSDLNDLKDSLAHSLLEFVAQVDSAINNAELISRLGDRAGEFNKLVRVFFADVDRFASSIQELRVKHEHLSGSIKNMEELNEFTNLSLKYQVMQVELQSLLAPTLTSLVLLINEIVRESNSANDVITDVQIKETSNV